MRGSAATFTASHAASISFSVERARDATVQSFTVFAMVLTDSKSPGEEIAKPASMISTFIFSRHFATSIFSRRFILQPGDCSPSRSVVSKIFICFIYVSPIMKELRLYRQKIRVLRISQYNHSLRAVRGKPIFRGVLLILHLILQR